MFMMMHVYDSKTSRSSLCLCQRVFMIIKSAVAVNIYDDACL